MMVSPLEARPMRLLRSSFARGSFLLGGVLLLSLAQAGCNSGDTLPRRAVSGKVDFEGKPLDTGHIEFLPVGSSQEGHAVMAGSPIKDGTYAISQAEGPIPGTYTVRISSPGEKNTGLDEDGMPAHP